MARLIPTLLRTAILAMMLASLPGHATTQPASETELEEHVTYISERLRCLVCQNQSIAESQAELANDLRRQVREMLVAGKSDKEVLAYMVERYGDFVLYDPPFQTTTLLLWGGPAALMLIALGGFAWTVRTRRKQLQPAVLTEEERARARNLLDRADNTSTDSRA
ncbi:cytochrome c-type biogenesis protein [Uliginosibacterium sp. H3]|uniref:Cytochrome c-type biogenesis protein n=1 Tax=Uliginosibacterium silvisoli TaxID=3114758 RepID=A0ABU6K6P5_9RHOO|nr:cytochrome c-type biogenesis protein [Uliginosibacterium sp. H3]